MSVTNTNNSTPCFLILEDGTILEGQSFGSKNDIDGEVGKVNTCSLMFSVTLVKCLSI